jgi:hypothetical protein
MRIYISGAIAGNEEENTLIARKVAIELWERGYSTFCPHLNTIDFHKDCKCGWEDYIRGDLEILSVFEAIVMLPNWMTSKGAVREREFARYLGMPVYYYPDLPVKRERMSDDQEAHLAQVINKIIRDLNKKYPDGQFRHGGNLFDKPNLPMLLEEVQDMVVYAYTLQEQIKKSIQYMLDGDETEARFILQTGNSEGRILKDA